MQLFVNFLVKTFDFFLSFMLSLRQENKKAGENALIILGTVVFALAVGYALTPLGAVPLPVAGV